MRLMKTWAWVLVCALSGACGDDSTLDDSNMADDAGVDGVGCGGRDGIGLIPSAAVPPGDDECRLEVRAQTEIGSLRLKRQGEMGWAGQAGLPSERRCNIRDAPRITEAASFAGFVISSSDTG